MITCVKPDERSVMTYVVAFYKAFANFNKNEAASKKIGNVLNTSREFDKLQFEYETRATDLLKWIPTVVHRLNERPQLTSVDVCRAKFEEYNQYKSVEFPPKFVEKGDLEAHYRCVSSTRALPATERSQHAADQAAPEWPSAVRAQRGQGGVGYPSGLEGPRGGRSCQQGVGRVGDQAVCALLLRAAH